jgi:hypothetical protein
MVVAAAAAALPPTTVARSSPGMTKLLNGVPVR